MFRAADGAACAKRCDSLIVNFFVFGYIILYNLFMYSYLRCLSGPPTKIMVSWWVYLGGLGPESKALVGGDLIFGFFLRGTHAYI